MLNQEKSTVPRRRLRPASFCPEPPVTSRLQTDAQAVENLRQLLQAGEMPALLPACDFLPPTCPISTVRGV